MDMLARIHPVTLKMVSMTTYNYQLRLPTPLQRILLIGAFQHSKASLMSFDDSSSKTTQPLPGPLAGFSRISLTPGNLMSSDLAVSAALVRGIAAKILLPW